MPSPSRHFSLSFPQLQLLFVFTLCLLSPAIRASEKRFRLDGNVLELDESNFDAAVSNFDHIFVDFYAPWCGHCNRLAPQLEKAAAVLAGLKQPIAVAKVDADKYKKLASDHGVSGYPTLKLFVHGIPTEYKGPRKADSIVRFLTKLAAPDVAVLSSDSAISEFIETSGSDFPIFIGFGLNESQILDLAVKYKKKAWFSVARNFSDEIMTVYDFDKVPAFVAIHSAYNEQITFYGPFEEKFLEVHIIHSLLPLVLPISQHSLQLLRDDPRKVLITILEDATEEKSKGIVKVLKAAAPENRDLIFGYVGFKQWEDFAESFEYDTKTHQPKMVVWDGNEEYYSVIGSESIDEANICASVSIFLTGYREGNVIQKRIVGLTLIGAIKSQLGIITVVILILLVLVVVLVISITNDESPTVGAREQVVEGRGPGPANRLETRELGGPVKED